MNIEGNMGGVMYMDLAEPRVHQDQERRHNSRSQAAVRKRSGRAGYSLGEDEESSHC